MSSFDLTTKEKVKAYLGITDTSSDDIIDDIVTAVSCEIELYCNRQFELDTYSEQIIGNGEDTVLLRNTPIEGILYSAVGNNSLIEVTYTGSAIGSVDVQEKEVRLIEGLSQTDIAIVDDDTIADVATAINAETNWTAETSDADLAVYPGRILMQRTYGMLEANQDISIHGPTIHLPLKEVKDGLYLAGQRISDGALVLYNGGYAVDGIPTQLEQLATQISSDTFKSIQQQANLKSEKVGDYAYSLNAEAQTAMEAYGARLDFYSSKAI